MPDGLLDRVAVNSFVLLAELQNLCDRRSASSFDTVVMHSKLDREEFAIRRYGNRTERTNRNAACPKPEFFTR